MALKLRPAVTLLRLLTSAPLAPVKIGLCILAVNLTGGQLRII
ncbi:hypothetical protein [Aeromonas sp. FDAARGOS 1417]|nr:hypothetical protein [Aeromonas sp. FDAARGOS 1417]